MKSQDGLDELLSVAQPAVSSSSAGVASAISQMSEDAQQQTRSGRRSLRPFAATLAVLLAVGGGATAAAAATFQWHPWAQEPDTSFMVTMPSGAECEYRIGNLQGVSAEVEEAVKAFVSTSDIVSLADIDGAIAQLRSDRQAYDEVGELQPVDRETGVYDEDFEYQFGFNLAVSELVADHLRTQGLLAPYSLDMQADCGYE